jgi:hypothetical protein
MAGCFVTRSVIKHGIWHCTGEHTHLHTHLHTYIHTYICIPAKVILIAAIHSAECSAALCCAVLCSKTEHQFSRLRGMYLDYGPSIKDSTRIYLPTVTEYVLYVVLSIQIDDHKTLCTSLGTYTATARQYVLTRTCMAFFTVDPALEWETSIIHGFGQDTFDPSSIHHAVPRSTEHSENSAFGGHSRDA